MTAIHHFADQNCVVYKNLGHKKLIFFLPYIKKFQVCILNMGPKNYWNLGIFTISEMSEIGLKFYTIMENCFKIPVIMLVRLEAT